MRYFDKLVRGAVEQGPNGKKKNRTAKTPRQAARANPQGNRRLMLEPPPKPKHVYEFIGMVVGVLLGVVFILLDAAGWFASFSENAVRTMGAVCGALYASVYFSLVWKKHRREDDPTYDRPARGRQGKLKKKPWVKRIWSLVSWKNQPVWARWCAGILFLTICVLNSLELITFWQWLLTQAIGGIIIAFMIPFLRLTPERRRELLVEWGDSFIKAMAWSALAHPAGSTEAALYLQQEYEERSRENQ